MENVETALEPVKVDKAIQEYKPNPAFVAAGALIPKSYKEVMELGGIMCKSGLVPKDMTARPEAAATAIMMGLELGISPVNAVQNIMILNGRGSIWGDLMKALVIGSGKCEVFDEDPPHKALEQGFGRCHLKRKDNGMENEIRFSIDDARRARLLDVKDNWKLYPGRMLQLRARSWACRDLFPDVLKGMQMREEVLDYIDVKPVVQMPEALPEKPVVLSEGPGIPVNPYRSEDDVVTITGKNPVLMAGDAQEPGNDLADLNKPIDEIRRKELFQIQKELKVSLSDMKIWLEQKGLKSTAELTYGLANELEAWLKGAK